MNIVGLISEEECYKYLRAVRWEHGIQCQDCGSKEISRKGESRKSEHCLRYLCRNCNRRFDDLTSTLFSKRHQPLKLWFICMYLMCLNVSNLRISYELGVGKNVAQKMASLIRNEVMTKTPEPALYGEVDEAYVISGHKGQRSIVWRSGCV